MKLKPSQPCMDVRPEEFGYHSGSYVVGNSKPYHEPKPTIPQSPSVAKMTQEYRIENAIGNLTTVVICGFICVIFAIVIAALIVKL